MIKNEKVIGWKLKNIEQDGYRFTDIQDARKEMMKIINQSESVYIVGYNSNNFPQIVSMGTHRMEDPNKRIDGQFALMFGLSDSLSILLSDLCKPDSDSMQGNESNE